MIAVAALVAAAAVTACSVDGVAQPVGDLEPLTVDAAAFPYGAATRVPAPQVPGAVADVTFRPLHGENRPADCTPAAVDTAGAQILVGPGHDDGASLTVLLARAGDSFDDFAAGLQRCSDFALGGTVGTRVATVLGARADDTVESGRTLTNAGRVTARVYEIVAQRGDVRLYVQNRFRGDDLDDAARSATRTLFDAAYARAFEG